jgi:arylsulfatase A-like enzyme
MKTWRVSINFGKALKKVLLAVVVSFLADVAHAADRPNVVILYADDLGYGDLGCYGHPRFKTPRLDKLAAEGARLTQFQSCCPFCAPSRTGLLTGRYPFRAQMVDNPAPDGGAAANVLGIPDREVLLGEVFQQAGYRTACFGKWHLGHQPQFHPLKHGFDEYHGILYSNDMRPVQLWDGDRVIENPVQQATLTERYTDRAIEFLRANKDRPFFLYLPHAMPHKPLAATDAFYRRTGTDLYGDVIAELDANIGRLLDELATLGLDQSTLVLFSSDNGPWYGGSTGGLRGMKGEAFEGGFRVPLIARWPGRIPAGHVSHAPAIILDLFPTVLKAAGIEPPQVDVIDGRDLWPLLTSDAKSSHEALYTVRSKQVLTVRQGRWKLHLVPARKPRAMAADEKWIDPRGPDGTTILAPAEQFHPSRYPGVLTGDVWTDVALFDLERDPSEQRNVAGEQPEITARLRELGRGMQMAADAALSGK